MPIKPEKRARYPGGSPTSPEWLAIRQAVLERADNRCELCWVHNHVLGYRDAQGRFRLDADSQMRIVLTVAHLYDDDEDCTDIDDLRALCQRCHNRFDAKSRSKNKRRKQ